MLDLDQDGTGMHGRSRNSGLTKISARVTFLGFCIAMIGVPLLYAVLRFFGIMARTRKADDTVFPLAVAGLFDIVLSLYWGGFLLMGIGGTLMGAGGLVVFATIPRR